MSKVIAIVNQKGGVAKSFTTANLAVGLVREGKKVLVIDDDPQGHASRCLGVKEADITIYDIMGKLLRGEQIKSGEGVIKTGEGVDLLPSNVRYAMMELELSCAMSREHLLSEFVEMERVDYDYILIDCPPNLGLFVLNALTAADSVLVPVKLEDLCLDGLQQLIQTVGMVKRRLNSRLEFAGILYTIVETKLSQSKDAMRDIKDTYGEYIKILDSYIPKTAKASECPKHGMSIFAYDPKGKTAKAYLELTKEVME